MSSAQLIQGLVEAFPTMPRQLQAVARWMIDHPADVALLSMRAQARRAGVPPATLTRLAQRLGFPGFDAVRKLFAASVRRRPESFHGRAEELIARRAEEGDAALVQDVFSALALHCQRLAEPENVARIAAAAGRLAAVERVFCLGLRSTFPAAYMFHYVRSLIGEASVLVDGAGGIGVDTLRTIGPADAALAVSVRPYARLTLDAVRFARGRNAVIVAVTDSQVSPLARLADASVLIGTETPSFFHAIAPAFAAVECLAALVAARKGAKALSGLAASEEQLVTFNTYAMPRARRRPR